MFSVLMWRVRLRYNRTQLSYWEKTHFRMRPADFSDQFFRQAIAPPDDHDGHSGASMCGNKCYDILKPSIGKISNIEIQKSMIVKTTWITVISRAGWRLRMVTLVWKLKPVAIRKKNITT